MCSNKANDDGLTRPVIGSEKCWVRKDARDPRLYQLRVGTCLPCCHIAFVCIIVLFQSKTAHGPGLHARRDDLERVTVGAAPPSRDDDRSKDGRNNLDVGQGVEIAVRGVWLGMGAVGTMMFCEN